MSGGARLAEVLRQHEHLLKGAPFISRHDGLVETNDLDGSRWYERPGSKDRFQSITWTISSTESWPGLAPWASGVTAELAVEYAALLLDMASDDPRAAVAWLKEEAERQRELAAAVGTHLHHVLEALLLDRQIPRPPSWLLGRVLRNNKQVIPITQETVDRWADGLLAFITQYRIRPVMVEATVANPRHRYAGRVDLVAELPGYGLVLIDLKSGRIKNSVIAQLAAMWHATEVWLPGGDTIPMPRCQVAAVLAVRPGWTDGFKLRPVPLGPRAWAWFLRANQTLIEREAQIDIGNAVMYPPEFGPGGEVVSIPTVPMIEDSGLRCRRLLAEAGFTWLHELTGFEAADLLSDPKRKTGIRGIGAGALKDIRAALAKHGLALAGDSMKGAA